MQGTYRFINWCSEVLAEDANAMVNRKPSDITSIGEEDIGVKLSATLDLKGDRLISTSLHAITVQSRKKSACIELYSDMPWILILEPCNLYSLYAEIVMNIYSC